MQANINIHISSNSNRLYYEYINYIIKDRLGNDNSVIRLIELYNIGFAAAKNGNLSDAAFQFELARSFRENISRESSVWLRALGGGNLSYYYYKIGDFVAAKQQTYENIESSRLIMEKYACWGLFWSEIQQLQNLGRIHLKESDIDSFLNICYDTFPKMYLALSTWKNTKIFEIWEWELFTAIGYDMFVQVFTETIQSVLLLQQGNDPGIKQDLSQCLKLISTYKYSSIQNIPKRFKLLDDFVCLFNKILTLGIESLNEKDLIFIDESKKNRELSSVLYNLIISVG